MKTTNLIHQLSALICVICGLILLPLTLSAQDTAYWTTGTGAWETAANWQGGEVPVLDSNINIGNGGEARYTIETYYHYMETYGGVPFFNNVSIANHSTLYLDDQLDIKNNGSLSLSNSSTLVLTQNSFFGYNFPNSQVNITGNSTINADVNGLNNFYANKFTGDGTGTINITGNGQMTHDAVMEIHDTNIHSEVIGTVVVDYLDGTFNLTVASGTFQMNYNDARTGGNTVVEYGAAVNPSSSAHIIVKSGYSISGGGDVGDVWVEDGGRISSSLILKGSLILWDGAVVEFNGFTALYFSPSSSTAGFYVDGDGVAIIDFSNVELSDGSDYVIIDWSATPNTYVDADNFSAVGTDMAGDFSVENSQLVFHTSAIPEPSIHILLGIGLALLLTARRRNVQS
jgi:hypothetical protein